MTTLKLVANLAQLATIRRFAEAASRDMGLEEQDIWDLEVAVDEDCTNVVQHAYQGQARDVEISIETVGDAVPLQAAEPSTPRGPRAGYGGIQALPGDLHRLGGGGRLLLTCYPAHADALRA